MMLYTHAISRTFITPLQSFTSSSSEWKWWKINSSDLANQNWEQIFEHCTFPWRTNGSIMFTLWRRVSGRSSRWSCTTPAGGGYTQFHIVILPNRLKQRDWLNHHKSPKWHKMDHEGKKMRCDEFPPIPFGYFDDSLWAEPLNRGAVSRYRPSNWFLQQEQLQQQIH